MAEKPTTVRFKPGINAGVRHVADRLGVSVNAALSVLLSEALEARGIDPVTGKPKGADGNQSTHGPSA